MMMNAAAASDEAPLLEVRAIGKRFPGVQALDGVSLTLRAGEVHAVVGENGAGKSTLMHLLAGVHRPDAGQVLLDGLPVAIADERDAQARGIAIVYQERSLFPLLSVAENVFAGRQPVHGPARLLGRIDGRALAVGARRWLAELEVDVDVDAPVSELMPAVQQMVEIAKALSLDPRVLILDEPTAALTETETSALFRVVRRLAERGIAILYISHRLEEIFALADRVSVLRDGTHQGTFDVADTSAEDLVRRMVGRDLVAGQPRPPTLADAPLALEVRGMVDAPQAVRPLLKDVSFSLRRGEVLAFAGLAGAGRTELALALFGARERGAGDILVEGRRIDPRCPGDAIAAGIGYLSEDRKDLGLFLDMSIAENIAAASLRRFGRFGLDDGKLNAAAQDYRVKLRIAARGIDQAVRSLSGGNQQKVALARWLLVGPRVLIVDEPTRGVDVGAKAEVHALLFEFAAEGMAIIAISSDLPEVLALGDRVAVMRQGALVAVFHRGEATEERIMRHAMGTARSAR